jgi:A/G-specific adenine glycosylase
MPSFGWSDDDGAAAVQELTNSWIEIGTINHIFTHFRLELQLLYGNCDCSPPSNCFWQPIQFLTDVGLPSVMKKVVSLVLSTQR